MNHAHHHVCSHVQVGAVYTVRSKGVSIKVLAPEQKFDLKLPTPEEDGQGFQYVSTLSGGTAVTELCIRGKRLTMGQCTCIER